ncbi:MAG: hypothetical protein QXX64_01935 [Nitrososphaera sp.]
MVNKGRMAFRAWYYLRTGYSIYLALILAGINSLVTVYYLAINNIPTLKIFFPNFSTWVVVILSIVIPLAIFIGWLHVKRSRAFSSELEVQTEVNPYYYKLPPGYSKELLVPTYLAILNLNLKILNKEPLTEEEEKQIKGLQKGLEHLINGGSAGLPHGRYIPSLKKNEKQQPIASDQ